MYLNTETTTHYRSGIIDIEELKNRVFIDVNHLREKPTWFDLNNSLQYFKARDDYRIFAELFFNKFASSIMNLETLKYSIAYMRTIKPNLKKSDEVSECGLLSENFQKKGYNNYLVGELMKPELSDFVAYGGYNLSSLLSYFKDTLAVDAYRISEEFLLKLYMSDAFVLQVDRNKYNIAFQIPEIPGVSYKERLHVNKLVDNKAAQDSLEYDSQRGIYLLKDFFPNVVYDSERCLGVHRNELTYRQNQTWCPAFPYNEDLKFDNQEEANSRAYEDYDGMDPNLFSLFIDYQDFCEPYFERLAYDDEYKKILEEFSYSNSPVQLTDSELEYFSGILEDRQKEFQKILKM